MPASYSPHRNGPVPEPHRVRCRTQSRSPIAGILSRTPVPALLDVVRKSMRLIRNAIGATTIDRELLTSAERLQHDGYLRCEEANAAIMAMAKDGVSIKQIVRQTGH